MRLCPGCECHVRTGESSCPFCGAAVSDCSAPRASLLGATALSAGLSMLGCSTDTGPTDTVADNSTTMMSGSETDGESSTTGDGDGDSTGDGDGDDWATDAAYGVPETACEDFGPEPVVLGDNAITVDMNFGSVYLTCGGVGTTKLFAFTAEADGDYEVAVVDADFAPALSLIDTICDPPLEIACTTMPEALSATLSTGDTVHIAVDSADMPVDGMANLQITAL